jgi:hypothetical protein
MAIKEGNIGIVATQTLGRRKKFTTKELKSVINQI